MKAALFIVQTEGACVAGVVGQMDRTDSGIRSILCAVGDRRRQLRAIGGFVVWCAYQLVYSLLWLSVRAFMACAYSVGVVWVVLLWNGARFVRVVILVLRALRRLGGALRCTLYVLIVSTVRVFGEPALCAACVYLGVLSASALPLALHAAPMPAGELALAPLAAMAITARIFDVRAYGRWQRGARTRLGARMLRAYSDGVMWSAWILMPQAERRHST